MYLYNNVLYKNVLRHNKSLPEDGLHGPKHVDVLRKSEWFFYVNINARGWSKFYIIMRISFEDH